jgi:abequosyltransferase
MRVLERKTKLFRISICIPTYNFGKYIGETLDSVTSQFGFDGSIEIIVFDGGSTDETQEIVLSRNIANLHYHYANGPGGIDADMMAATKLASGEFIWLLSSDDVLPPGALWTILREIARDSASDLFVGTHTNCDINLRFMNYHPIFDEDLRIETILSDKNSRIEMLRKAKNSESIFSFMSTLVIKNQVWHSVELDKKFMGTCWAHAARIFTIASEKELKVTYLNENIVYKRGENDSFLQNDLLGRIALSINGYHAIAKHFFGEKSEEYDEIRRIISNEITLPFFVFAITQSYRALGHSRYRMALQLARLNFKFGSRKYFVALIFSLVGQTKFTQKPLQFLIKLVLFTKYRSKVAIGIVKRFL